MRQHANLLSRAKVFTVLMTLAVATAPLPAGEPMPGTLTTKLAHIDQSYPTWVSVATATLPDGSLDAALFHPVLWRQLQDLLDVPVDHQLGCRPVGEVIQSWLAPPDTSTLASTFQSARLVMRARVVNREFGFDRGTPGQLFQVERLETYKGQDDLPIFYFFVPAGRFRAGGEEICKTDYRFPNGPAIGEEVVLLIPEVSEGDPLLDLAFEAGLMILRDEQPLLASWPGLPRKNNLRQGALRKTSN